MLFYTWLLNKREEIQKKRAMQVAFESYPVAFCETEAGKDNVFRSINKKTNRYSAVETGCADVARTLRLYRTTTKNKKTWRPAIIFVFLSARKNAEKEVAQTPNNLCIII